MESSNGKCSCSQRMDGKTVIVTGASSGIGKETARVLASRGARVIVACRDRARGEATEAELRELTGSEEVIFMRLDLASFDSIREFAKEFLLREEFLHVLVNNAGIINANNYVTADGYELSFGVNHLGHFLLTNLLIERLKESAPSRVVNVSSYSYRLGVIDVTKVWESEGRVKSYARSKLANILFTRGLAARLEDSGVATYSLHPGSVNTGIKRNWSKWLKKTEPMIRLFLKSAEEGAKASIHCAVAGEYELCNGAYYEGCKAKKLSSKARDDNLAQELWEKSVEFTGGADNLNVTRMSSTDEKAALVGS